MPGAVLTNSFAGAPSEVGTSHAGSPEEHGAGDTHFHVSLEEGDIFPEAVKLRGS